MLSTTGAQGNIAGDATPPGAPILPARAGISPSCTRPGFETWLCRRTPIAVNPGAVDYMMGNGASLQRDYRVAPWEKR